MTEPASGGVRGLGELALRVDDLDAMTAFYRDVVGLSVLREFDHATFFDVSEGYGGHTTIVALFDRAGEESALDDPDTSYTPPDAAATTVDHFAFTVAREDFDAERERLESLGVALEFATHEWVSWRSLYFSDPEGNSVEFVCYDPAVADD
ncbi:VOC family protein [Halorubellus litoreus]|uniref:VOC family protein n=1 Tax=Halorubellus litoreus TaxID=755308 RepID=A0ABD5VEU1_9EURY